MSSIRISMTALIPAILLTVGCGGPTATTEPPQPELAVTSHSSAEVAWESEWKAAFDRARALDRPVMASFYADWCVWCKTLETITFRDEKVVELLANRVVPLTIDIEGSQQQRARDLGVQAPPTIIFLQADGRELGRIPGYLPPAQFLTVVEKILAGEPVTFS